MIIKSLDDKIYLRLKPQTDYDIELQIHPIKDDNPDTGNWLLITARHEGTNEAVTGVFKTQSKSIERARKYLKKHPGVILVHSMDGDLKQRITKLK